MPGTVKKLQFSEGTDVGAPTDLSLQTSTSVIKEYANDAAYALDQPAAEGGVYLNTTTTKFRYYVNGFWRNAVPESDASDSTKVFLVDVSGNTTGMSAQLRFIASGNRIYTFPNQTDEVVLKTFVQILTNKELTAALLELPIIKGTVKAIDVDTAADLAIGASVGAHNITIGGSSATVIIPGNFTINGTITAINSANLNVTDKNITMNNGGNDASSEGAGITVKRTTVDGSQIYAAAAASKWKIGNVGAEVEAVDISTGQTITNKRLHLQTTVAANDSTSPRFVLPQNTLANLTAISGANHPAAGATYWATDVLQSYVWNGTSLVPLGGSGSGSGEINAVTNGSVSNDLTGYTAGTSHTNTRVTTGSPLDPVIATAVSVSATTTAAESSTSGSYYTISTHPVALRNKKLKVEFYFITQASQTWNVGVYSGSTRMALSTDSSAATILPANTTGKFVAYFDADASTTYTVHLTRTAGAGTTTLVYTNLIVGPGIQPQGAVVQEWQLKTVTGSWVSNTTYICWERRCGDSVDYDILVSTSGAPTATALTVNLPTGRTIDVAKIASTGSQLSGSTTIHKQGVDDYVSSVIYNSTTSFKPVNVVATGGSGTPLAYGGITNTSPVTFANNDFIRIKIWALPIAEFSGSGTVNLAQNDAEYVSNTSVSDANDTTSFAYGISGSPVVGTLTDLRNKRVRFNTPILQTDVLTLEFRDGSVTNSPWLPHGSFVNSANDAINTLTYQNTSIYGAAFKIINLTDVDVKFATYPQQAGTTYGSAGSNWGAGGYLTTKWRLKKVSAGAAVGFGIVGDNASGLMPAVNSSLTDGAGARLGYKTFYAGTTYNGVNPTVDVKKADGTTSQASQSIVSVFHQTWQDSDGRWFIWSKGVVNYTAVTESNIFVNLTGIVFRNISGFNQVCTANNSNGTPAGAAFGQPNTNQIRGIFTASTSSNQFSWDITAQLETKPTYIA